MSRSRSPKRPTDTASVPSAARRKRTALLVAFGGAAMLAVYVVARMTHVEQEAPVAAAAAAPAPAVARAPEPPPGKAPDGMRWIPGGEFTMGTSDPQSMINERPAH